MKNILITSSTFAQENASFLDVITSKGFQYVLNPFLRTMNEEELRNGSRYWNNKYKLPEAKMCIDSIKEYIAYTWQDNRRL